MNYSEGLFNQAYKELREGIAAQGGVIAKKPMDKKEDPKAKGGEDKGSSTSEEDRVKQALYDIRYRAKREGVPVAQAMTDYLKHSASLGPKARTELKKKLMGEEVEQIDEISSHLALTASQKADEMRRKAAVAGDTGTAAKKAAQASRLYKGVGPRKAKERMAKEEVEIDEATAMAKRGYDEAPIRQKIAKSTGGGEAADRATKLADRPTYGDSNKAKQRQNLARKQRGDFRNTTSSSPGLHGYAHKSDDPKVKAKQAARGAQRGALTPAEKKQLGREEFENWVNELVNEGYDLSDYTWDEMYEFYLDEALTGERYKKVMKKPGGTAYSRKVSADPSKRAKRGGKGGESDFGAGDRGSGNKAARRAGTYQEEEYAIDEAKKMKGEDPCWKGYEMVGTKKKGGKEVPNCVPKEETDAMLQKQQLQLNRKKLAQQTKAVQKNQQTDMTMKEDVSTEELVHLYNILENDHMEYMHDVAQARVEEILEAQQEKISATQKKGPSGDTLYKVRVVNVDGRSEVRYASRAKIAELRGNSNIKSVEITGYGEPNNYSDKSDKKELDPVGKEDGDVDNDGDKDKSDNYLMKRRNAIGKAIAAKEEFSSIFDDLTDLEVALLSDSMIDEIAEELIYECLEEGYEIDLLEEAICESLDASLAVIMEANPYAAAGSKEARAYNKSANASKRAKDRAEKIEKVKSAVKSKAAEVGSRVRSAASTTGSMAKTAAKKAGNAAATGAGAVAGAAAGAGKELGSSFKKGFKAGYKATTKKADGGGEKKPGILSRIKNKVKSAIGTTARKVATKMGEEYSLGK